MLGYVLISLGASVNEKIVFDKLADLEKVEDANMLFGEWDIILKLKCTSPDEFSAFVLDNIRVLSEVKMTSTMIVAK